MRPVRNKSRRCLETISSSTSPMKVSTQSTKMFALKQKSSECLLFTGFGKINYFPAFALESSLSIDERVITPSLFPLWRDCKTTHLLLAVCDAPHEPVEISVAGCAQIEVVYHGSQDLGVRLSQPLGVCLNGKFPGDVLAQKTKQVNLFWGDRLRHMFNIGSHDSQREC